MKKSLLFCLLVFVLSIIGCVDEAADEAGTGTLKVTVNTPEVIWGYPNGTLTYTGASNY